MCLDNLKINQRSYYNLPNSAFWGWLSMESQPQNPEFRINPENVHPWETEEFQIEKIHCFQQFFNHTAKIWMVLYWSYIFWPGLAGPVWSICIPSFFLYLQFYAQNLWTIFFSDKNESNYVLEYVTRVQHLVDNCIQNFHLRRYSVRYTVRNLFYGHASSEP